MNLTKSSNPAFGEDILDQELQGSFTERMTLNGAINKSIIMLLLVVIPASLVFIAGGSATGLLTTVGAIGGLIAALVTIFKRTLAPYTAPIYAILEGLFVGGLSAMYASAFEGIIVQAVTLTLGVAFMMLFAYRSGLIKATNKFVMGVFAATAGVALVYLVGFITSLFGVHLGIFEGGMFAILFSLAVVVIAALNLIIDFAFIEQSAQSGAPKYMEWYGAFGLMVTLIWLYVSMLRLLSMLSRE